MFDGNQRPQIIATAAGYYEGRKAVEVVDDGLQTGDFTGDGLVGGSDFLRWQRGLSPDPLSSTDLIDWQDNYGNLPPTLASSTAELNTQSTADASLNQSFVPLLIIVASSPPFEASFSDPIAEAWPQLEQSVNSTVSLPVEPAQYRGYLEQKKDADQENQERAALESLFTQWGSDHLRINFRGV